MVAGASCCCHSPGITHMLGLVDRESRVNAAMLGVPLCQSAGTVERSALELRSRRIRACRFCQVTGKVLESWFWLRSATVRAVSVLHAVGKGPVRLGARKGAGVMEGQRRAANAWKRPEHKI